MLKQEKSDVVQNSILEGTRAAYSLARASNSHSSRWRICKRMEKCTKSRAIQSLSGFLISHQISVETNIFYTTVSNLLCENINDLSRILEFCQYNMPIFRIICSEIRVHNKITQMPGFLMYLVFGKDSSCGFNQFFRNFSQKSKFTHFHQTLLCMHCLNFCFMDSLDVTSYPNRF